MLGFRNTDFRMGLLAMSILSIFKKKPVVTSTSIQPTRIEPKSSPLIIEWRSEPPRRRSVIVAGRPRRIALSQHTAFLISNGGEAGSYGPQAKSLHSWTTDAELRPDIPLLMSPFRHSRDEMSHVYGNGHVCFEDDTLEDLKRGKLDHVETFWGSDMHVLPSWLTRPPGASMTWEAPVQKKLAWAFSYEMPFRASDDYYYDRDTGPQTPRKITERLLRNSVGNFMATDRTRIKLSAPWMKRAVTGTPKELLRVVQKW